MGMSIEQVEHATQLSKEEIEKISKEKTKNDKYWKKHL